MVCFQFSKLDHFSIAIPVPHAGALTQFACGIVTRYMYNRQGDNAHPDTDEGTEKGPRNEGPAINGQNCLVCDVPD